MSVTRVQESSYKRIKRLREPSDTAESNKFKVAKYNQVATNVDVAQPPCDPIAQITFNARNQSILSITHLKEPLKLQTKYPIPEILPHEILVNNKAIGLNPIDWKGKKYGFGIYHFPWINGRESSGDIVKIGSQVKEGLRIGDKVILSSTCYRDNRTSTFQQYTAIDSRLVWKLPQNFTYEDGATIGVGLVTAGVLLYNSFGFKLESKPKPKPKPCKNGTLLVWGGATIVGIYVTQLAKLNGLRVISVASTKHERYLKEIGVDELVNRHLQIEEIQKQVYNAAPNGIDFGIDCVSKETSVKVLSLLDENHKKLAKHKTKSLFAGIVGVPREVPSSVELKEVVIKRFHEDVAFGAKFIEATTSFLDNRLIKPARYKQYKGGLEIIDDALKDLETMGANGEKYVVSIQE
ncbi:hypothetical protein KGF56_002931 [Candida oxycetoniae]|uniref:Enoyl reductase (ER) domain-containing protein n=1 Tax=Candida oxycetoniae TaxID=497107 RepID=A0AAI9SWK5_9ASCO|nr:uncharacterized protein KGF56_002931 [Candida oxycetoniae]KAI3404292.2 hypothetical protein KGF56_002931 [Candida oxycetoniae]